MLQLLDDHEPGVNGDAADDETTQITLSSKDLKLMIAEAVGQAMKDQTEPEEADDDNQSVLLDDGVSTSEDISEALATAISTRLTEQMHARVMTKKQQTYSEIPKNLSSVLVPTRVNLELWSSIPVYAKNRDKRLVTEALVSKDLWA